MALAPSVLERVRRGSVGAPIETSEPLGVTGYLGDGSQDWPLLHRHYATWLLWLAMKRAEDQSVLRGADEEGVTLCASGEPMGDPLRMRRHAIPVAGDEANFGWFAIAAKTPSPALQRNRRPVARMVANAPRPITDPAPDVPIHAGTASSGSRWRMSAATSRRQSDRHLRRGDRRP